MRPRTALKYFGMRHASCRFRIAARPRAVSICSAVQMSESESKHRSGSGNARCLIVKIEVISLYMVYSKKCVKMSFHVIHFYTERAFGKPKRDVRPALHNDAPMTSFVPGYE